MSATLEERQAFDDHAESWEQYTRTPLGRLRQQLVLHHLLRHLDACPPGLRVLDAGSGSGGYALALAQKGHHVCLVDFSQAMLDIARHNLQSVDRDVLRRTQFHCCPVEEIPNHLVGATFDIVLCHTLLEYLARPYQVLEVLVGLLAPQGTLSLLLANPGAEALHWALAKRDLDRARQSLGSSVGQADLFGLPRSNLNLEMVREALHQGGVELVAEHGVRVFADYLTKGELADEGLSARLWQLEVEAGDVETYRRISRYIHVIGIKRF